ncbi:MAG: DNA-binding response regulator [Chitinophagia bacterium]|nr:DNA-binding response regulator [Chitinophagia bacterium]
MKKEMIKVIMADDHILLRNALASLIDKSDSCKVIAEASNGKELIDAIQKDNYPDIAILDLNMPVMDGHETAQYLQKHHPKIKVLMLTMYDSELVLIRLLKAGVKGFMKKDIHPKELIHADTPILEKITLSDAEVEFLKHVCSEQTYKEIAFDLGMNPRAIDGMRDNLFNRLDVKSRVGLAMYAIRHGIVPI